MPIEVGFWRIDGRLRRVEPSRLERESTLERLLVEDPSLLGEDLLVLGKQVTTGFGKRIDLLAVNADGELVVIELKRDRTPRDVVAQLLDYASWVRELTYEDVREVFDSFSRAASQSGEVMRFEEAFSQKFGASPPESLNQSHRLIAVASEMDAETERIVAYLGEDYAVPINVVLFSYFKDGANEYLSRTWLRDPMKTADTGRKKEQWNGLDFYVSLGEGKHRSWEDCVRYGFISGGQGRWYSRTLEMLFPNARVFVCIPGSGYVGVGIVQENAVPVREVTVQVDGNTVPLLEAHLVAPNMDDNADDPDRCEYVVRVQWIKTVNSDQAIWETGMFANQNTVCRLRNSFTLERLIEHFGLED